MFQVCDIFPVGGHREQGRTKKVQGHRAGAYRESLRGGGRTYRKIEAFCYIRGCRITPMISQQNSFPKYLPVLFSSAGRGECFAVWAAFHRDHDGRNTTTYLNTSKMANFYYYYYYFDNFENTIISITFLEYLIIFSLLKLYLKTHCIINNIISIRFL